MPPSRLLELFFASGRSSGLAREDWAVIGVHDACGPDNDDALPLLAGVDFLDDPDAVSAWFDAWSRNGAPEKAANWIPVATMLTAALLRRSSTLPLLLDRLSCFWPLLGWSSAGLPPLDAAWIAARRCVTVRRHRLFSCASDALLAGGSLPVSVLDQLLPLAWVETRCPAALASRYAEARRAPAVVQRALVSLFYFNSLPPDIRPDDLILPEHAGALVPVARSILEKLDPPSRETLAAEWHRFSVDGWRCVRRLCPDEAERTERAWIDALLSGKTHPLRCNHWQIAESPGVVFLLRGALERAPEATRARVLAVTLRTLGLTGDMIDRREPDAALWLTAVSPHIEAAGIEAAVTALHTHAYRGDDSDLARRQREALQTFQITFPVPATPAHAQALSQFNKAWGARLSAQSRARGRMGQAARP